MPWLNKERLTTISALRRIRNSAPFAPAPADPGEPGDRLAKLVGAAIDRNLYGEFLRVERWSPEPKPCEAPQALARILRPAPDPNALADPQRWLFLDTETTGVAGGTGTCAFLVGLAWWERGRLKMEQLFLRDFDEEHAVLFALAERLEKRRVLVTYNGKCFDWPLLETRFRLTRQIEPDSPRAHLDMLFPARQLWRLQTGTARLPDLERFVLGIDRGPDILSALIPEIYFDYLRTGNPEALVPVFRHNLQDLLGLAALTRRVALLADAPEQADPLEQYGLSRLLERSGERARARRVYEMAIESGLPRALRLGAQRRMARLAQRDGQPAVAHSIWRELAAEIAQGNFPEDQADRKQMLEIFLEACEKLAIHYEHREHNPEEAIRWTRHAAERFHAEPCLDRRFRQRWVGRLARRLQRLI